MEPVIVRNANGKVKKVAPDPLERWLSSYPEKHRIERLSPAILGFCVARPMIENLFF